MDSEEAYCIASDKMDAIIEKEIKKRRRGKEIQVIYSAYKTTEDAIPINNLNKIAARGKCKFVALAEDYFMGEEGKNYYSKVVTDPTWLEVTVLANDMIIRTGDYHHVFLEGINKIRVEGDVKIYEFVMGS